MEKIPMTRMGFDGLDRELRQLKGVERPAVIRAIAEAREHGDLSENAEYHAAREKQSFIEGRIKELEMIISRAEVIDPATEAACATDGTTPLPPAAFPEEMFAALAGAQGDRGAGALLREIPAARRLTLPPDRLRDIDRPEDLRAGP